MDRQGNKYTFLYASVMVVVVATILAFISESLTPLQKENERQAKMIDILNSIGIESTAQNVSQQYDKYIGDKVFIVNFEGERQDVEAQKAFNIDLSKEVRKPLTERQYPVYEAHLDNGEVKYILPVRGKGLWGPIWGYIALNEDKKTIYGATFDHKAETPGLGAEIAQDAFQNQFKGKTIFDEDGELVAVDVVKGGVPDDAPHSVDAVSGGTITSQGLETMLVNYLTGYEAFLKNKRRES